MQLITYMIENNKADLDPNECARIYFDTWMEDEGSSIT